MFCPSLNYTNGDMISEGTNLLSHDRVDHTAQHSTSHSSGRPRSRLRTGLTKGNLVGAAMFTTALVALVYMFGVMQDKNQDAVGDLAESLAAGKELTNMPPNQKKGGRGWTKPHLVSDEDAKLNLVEAWDKTRDDAMVEKAWKGGIGETIAEKDAMEAKLIELQGSRQRQVPEGDYTREGSLSGERASGSLAEENGAKEGDEDSLGGNLPNVFFILIDDMGYGDIGYQSSDLKEVTPNLDRLASEGVKLTNYYSMHLCTPARSALMTGRYPVRYGFQYSVIQPAETWGLPLWEKIMPQYFNDAGYISHMVGKWHLGSYDDDYTPYNRGFDTFVGFLNDEEDYWTHQSFSNTLDGRMFFDFGYGDGNGYQDMTLREDDDPEEFSSYIGRYSTDVFTERAEEILMNKDPFDESPLFMYIAYQAVHDPLGPPPDDAFTREERDILDHIPTNDLIRKKFAEVLMYLDKRIGQFIDSLSTQGWLENSLVVVASDNGGCPTSGSTNYPLRGAKRQYFEGGIKVPAFVYSQSHIPLDHRGIEYNKLMHVTDWLPTFASALGWNTTEGMAGELDGVDQWPFDYRPSDDVYMDPRSELLYNWDEYQWDDDKGGLVEYPAKGAFRSGDWKMIFNDWCTGYYSFDNTLTDHLVNANMCEFREDCVVCGAGCYHNLKSIPGDYLFNLKDDPREQFNLIDDYPKVAVALGERANKVVNQEWVGSLYTDIDCMAYRIWAHHNDWMLPWYQYSLNMSSNSSCS